MGRLIYNSISSLDGYIADRDGNFDWCMPDEEVHRFANDLMRPIGTHLYGRQLYEVMVAWENFDLDELPPVMREFAELWRATDKVVYSRTLTEVSSARTSLEPEFDAAAVRRFVDESETDVSIGGPTLAAHALRAGIVDEVSFLVSPVVIGGGKAALPDDLRIDLELLEHRRFGNGVVQLRYDVQSSSGAAPRAASASNEGTK